MGRHPNPLTPQMLKETLIIIERRRGTLEKYSDGGRRDTGGR